MSELTQSLRWQEEQRNLEWRRACRFDEHRRYSQEEKDLHRRIWRQRLRHPSKLSPELAKKVKELEETFTSSSPEAEARRQKERESYQKWFAARKARIDKSLEIIQASREKVSGEMETL